MNRNTFLLKGREEVERLDAELGRNLSVRRLPAVRMERTFMDTFDWRLYGACMAAASIKGRPDRFQLLDSADGAAIHVCRLARPRFVSDIPPGPLRERLAPVLDVRALLLYAAVTTEAVTWEILNADRKVVSRLHVETHSAGEPDVAGTGARISLAPRLRVASLRGYRAASESLAEFLSEHVQLEEAPDLVAEIAKAAGKTPGDYSSKLSIKLSPQTPAADALRIIFRTLYAVMTANEQGVIRDLDPEFLHDFRVAVRRTRSALTRMKGIMHPDEAARFMREFKWLGGITGPSRDLDVYLLHIPDFLESLPEEFREDLLPLKHFLETLKKSEHLTMVGELASPRYRKLKEEWTGFLAQKSAQAMNGEASERPVAAFVNEWIRKAFRRTLKAGTAITEESPPEKLHQLRILCKKLRYLLEFFRSLYPEDEVSGSIDTLKGLQDNLGAFNDLRVQVASLETYGRRMGIEKEVPHRTLLAMGMLIHVLLERQLQVRGEFRSRFAEFAGAGNRAHFEKLLQPPEGEPAL